MKNVLFVASECVPFIKTGGLADVIGSLPKYIDKTKYDVRVIMPKYLCIPEKYRNKMRYVTHFYTDFCFRSQYVGVLEMEYEGVHFYFLDSEFYFGGPWPYHNMYEDIEKFAFFSRQVLSCLPLIGFRPDIIHCHDWQAGLVPVYLNDSFQGDMFFMGIKTIMTIHNLKFQGTWDCETIKHMTGLSDYYFTSDKLESYHNGNLLKGGLVYSDIITTVSETYAQEIQTPFYGEGLDGLIFSKSNRLKGIVNGLDYKDYDPAADPNIEVHFDVNSFRDLKVKNKVALQRELGLREDPHVFMIGIISRLTSQKGFDLIQYMMDQICTDDVQLVVLGTGEGRYEQMFRDYAAKFPDSVSANIFYSEALSRRIYASCDAFLMPSLFEPCGLTQLMSLRYGTLPIVRETGGLKDTVIPYNEVTNEGTGFSFANYNAHEMMKTIEYAKEIFYRYRYRWDEMVERAMKSDFSWDASARKYEQLYEDLIIQAEKELKEALERQERERKAAEEAAKKAAEEAEKLAKVIALTEGAKNNFDNAVENTEVPAAAESNEEN